MNMFIYDACAKPSAKIDISYYFADMVSRISVRGTLTDVHDENTRTPVEASNATPYPVIRTVLDGPRQP